MSDTDFNMRYEPLRDYSYLTYVTTIPMDTPEEEYLKVAEALRSEIITQIETLVDSEDSVKKIKDLTITRHRVVLGQDISPLQRNNDECFIITECYVKWENPRYILFTVTASGEPLYQCTLSDSIFYTSDWRLGTIYTSDNIKHAMSKDPCSTVPYLLNGDIKDNDNFKFFNHGEGKYEFKKVASVSAELS